MENKNAETRALELAHEMVMSVFPLTRKETKTEENGFTHTVALPGRFFDGIDAADEDACKLQLETMARFIGMIARQMLPR